jgi:general secretion pathway protein F
MMSSSGSELRRITLEDLAALNREVAALVRSGPTGRLAAQLGEDMSAGNSLSAAVAARGDLLPPIYRAVVAAGVRSGRLALALEGFADAAAQIAALRRNTLQAIIYPMIVISLAWVMFLALATNALPEHERVTNHRFWGASLQITNSTLWILAAALPLLLVVLVVAWWRATAAPWSGRQPGWLQRIPGGRRANRLSAQANFADLLHLMLMCQAPLPEALPLAASASGALSLKAPATELAAALERGEPMVAQRDALHQLPPMVRTALMAPGESAGMLAGLRRASDTYRERATSWVANASVIMPVAITLGVGVGVVGLYGLLILMPYFATLREIAEWNWR